MLERKAAILVGLLGIVTVLGFISGVAPGLLLSSEMLLCLNAISVWVSSSLARLCLDDDQCCFLSTDHHSCRCHCHTSPAAGLLRMGVLRSTCNVHLAGAIGLSSIGVVVRPLLQQKVDDALVECRASTVSFAT